MVDFLPTFSLIFMGFHVGKYAMTMDGMGPMKGCYFGWGVFVKGMGLTS